MIGKIKVGGKTKEFSFDAPVNFGRLILEAFVDSNGDGPGPGDSMGIYVENPLQIEDDDIQGVEIIMSIPEDGKMPSIPVP